MPRSSQQPPSSFSFVLKVGDPGEEWTLALQDLNPLATSRELRLDVPRPTPQPADNCPLIKTIGKPLAGRLEYAAVYLRIHQKDAEEVEEPANEGVGFPQRDTHLDGAHSHPAARGPQDFARIIRSRAVGSHRPESLFKKALKVVLSILGAMRAMWRKGRRLVAKTLCKIF